MLLDERVLPLVCYSTGAGECSRVACGPSRRMKTLSARAGCVNSSDECGNWSACSVARPEILKEALDVARVKKPILPLPSWSGRKDGSPSVREHRQLDCDKCGSLGQIHQRTLSAAPPTRGLTLDGSR